ncbi:hypothetical protein [Streptomyces sp. TP-A0356]|uniref:hypothetical protein n=1 Tax=Streptomyces sp. TP-A0356 TaxID=1359208 RepID=UPI0006E1DEC1|nr:hypothetical protein [Streptomyces sp. TP-A0356]
MSLTIDTPAGTVRATAGPRQDDPVIFELRGTMPGSVHVTGTHHPHRWDQFTAVRACLGPVNGLPDHRPRRPPAAAHPQPHRLPGQPDPYDDDTHRPSRCVR